MLPLNPETGELWSLPLICNTKPQMGSAVQTDRCVQHRTRLHTRWCVWIWHSDSKPDGKAEGAFFPPHTHVVLEILPFRCWSLASGPREEVVWALPLVKKIIFNFFFKLKGHAHGKFRSHTPGTTKFLSPSLSSQRYLAAGLLEVFH